VHKGLAGHPPGLGAIEVRTPLPHGRAGKVALIPRLLNKPMENEAVDSRAICRVPDRLGPRRCFGPLAVTRTTRERLGLDDVLPALAQRRDGRVNFIRHVLAASCPELGHHPIHFGHDLVLPPRTAIRFAEKLQLRRVQHLPDGCEIRIAVEIKDRVMKIAPEFPRFRVAADHASGEGREKRCQIVAAPLGELLAHLRRPAGHAGFVAVEVYVRKARADEVAEIFLNFADNVVHVEGHRQDAHLVTLEPCRLPLCRLDQRPHGRMSEPIHDPVARRCVPLLLAGQVDYLVFRDHAACR